MNRKQIKDNLRTVLLLEWFGIRIEDVRDEKDSHGLPLKMVYYFSVPEASTIEHKDSKLNDRIKTADGLKSIAKEVLTDILIDSCESEYIDDVFVDDVLFGGDESAKESAKAFVEDAKNNFSDYFKFYAKVRKGEVWSKELGDKRIKELTDEMQKASGYEEV